MKKTELMTKLTRAVSKAAFQVKKHSPEILIVTGAVGAVVSTVMACKATLKVEEVLAETNEKMEAIQEAKEHEATPVGLDYSKEDAQKDTIIVYTQTGLKLIKLYGPAVALGALSMASIFASNKILRKRNVALAAAYATVETSFKEYRKRVVEQFGKETDWMLKHGIKAQKVVETVKDEKTGEEKVVEKDGFVATQSGISGHARFFAKYTEDERGNSILNPHWEANNEYNLMFIKAQENYANDLLRAKGRLFLNEVYEMLGMPATKAGQIVGWVYDPTNGRGDNYVDFGLYSDSLVYLDDRENAILLDFNVDGNIWDLM